MTINKDEVIEILDNQRQLALNLNDEVCADCIYEIREKVHQLSEASPWHTGTPTEEGLYVVFNEHLCYDIVEVKPWTTLYGVVAYQKIEPYKEKEDD